MEKQSVIKVVIDHREMNDNLKEALSNEPGVVFETNTLKTGDFFINGFILIKGKTFKDLVASIRDGTILHRAFRLTISAIHTLIIIEGTAQGIKSTVI